MIKRLKQVMKPALAYQYLLWMLAFNTVLSLGYTALETHWRLEEQKQQVTLLHNQILRAYQKAISHSIWQLDESLLAIQLESITALELITQASSSDSMLTTQSGELSAQEPSWFIASLMNQRVISQARPLYHTLNGQARPLGQLKLNTDLLPIYQQVLAQFPANLLTNFIKTIPVVLFALLVFNQMLISPLTQLIDYLRSGALLQRRAPNFDVQREAWVEHSGDEVNQVADSLNHMKANLEELRQSLNSVDEVIFTLDANGIILQANQAAERLVSTMTPQVKGHPLASLLTLVDNTTQHPLDLVAVCQGRAVNTALTGYTLTLANAKQSLVACLVQPIQSQSGANDHDHPPELGHAGGCVIMLSQTSRDTEKPKLDHQQLEQLEAHISKVSHEINNTLAGVLSATELLKANPSSPYTPAIDQLSDQIIDAVTETSKQLGTLSPSTERETRQANEPIDLKHLLDQNMQQLQQRTPNTLRIEYHASPLPSQVYGNHASLQHALDTVLDLNRLSKNIDALSVSLSDQSLSDSHAARLGLHDSHAQRYACLRLHTVSVHSNASELPRLIKGFSRVYRTLAQHKGAIDITHTPQQGYSIALYLPLQAPAAAASDSQQCYLVVDDEKMMRDLLNHILSAKGHSVFCAENGQHAVDVWQAHKHQIDTVITDFNMPVMDGLALCQILKAQSPTLPIIVSSAYINSTMRRAFNAINVNRFLHKPYTQKQLNEVLNPACTTNTQAQKS